MNKVILFALSLCVVFILNSKPFVFATSFAAVYSDSLFLSNDTFAVLPELKDTFITGSKAQASTLSFTELDTIKALLIKAIDDYNVHTARPWFYDTFQNGKSTADSNRFIISLYGYVIQLYPFIDRTGEKIVWINCSCVPFAYWKRQRIFVNDGGNCFFNLKVNLTRHSFSDFDVNSEA